DHGRTGRHGNWRSPNEWLLSSVASAYASRVLRLADEPSDRLQDSRVRLPDPIATIVDQALPPRDQQGIVVFFTGLSGSGKSTLARALVDHVLERGDRTVTSLDGDVVRHHLSKGLGFSREDRETNILRIGYVAAEISRHGGMAICSPIAPFESTRQQVKFMVERAGGGFVLVHVSTPLEECERRDRKGLYARARAGEIPDFTGISSPYEEPTNVLKIDTAGRLLEVCLRELLDALVADGWLSP
ncbi:MAG: adenylyl-sulfate kinase, partial [Nocardioidaceae bacterium]|nr:adenylyl-sulfate kinase [Nocardioidaceae bacterium]